jgi:hypothetical protein
VVHVRLGRVHRDDRDAVAVELATALAEELLEVDESWFPGITIGSSQSSRSMYSRASSYSSR